MDKPTKENLKITRETLSILAEMNVSQCLANCLFSRVADSVWEAIQKLYPPAPETCDGCAFLMQPPKTEGATKISGCAHEDNDFDEAVQDEGCEHKRVTPESVEKRPNTCANCRRPCDLRTPTVLPCSSWTQGRRGGD